MISQELHPSIKGITFFGCALIAISQFFLTIEHIDNNVIFSFPDKELLLIGLLCISLGIFCRPSFTIEISVLVFFIYCLYAIIITIITYPASPELSIENETRDKFTFISGLVIFHVLLCFWALYLSKTDKEECEGILKIFFDIAFFQCFIGLFFWIAFILKFNPSVIGVNIGYNVPRAQGFTEEPSNFGPLALMCSIYFLRSSKVKAAICFAAAIVSLSATFFFILGILLLSFGIYKLFQLKSWFLKIGIAVSFCVIVYVAVNAIPQSRMIFLMVGRIFEHLDLLFSFLKGGIGSKGTIYAPRISAMLNGLALLLNGETFWGNGLGYQVYIIDNWNASIPFYLIALTIETGIVGLFLHFFLLKIFFKKLYIKNKQYVFLALIPLLVWLINGGVSYFFFYIFGFLIYFAAKHYNEQDSGVRYE